MPDATLGMLCNHFRLCYPAPCTTDASVEEAKDEDTRPQSFVFGPSPVPTPASMPMCIPESQLAAATESECPMTEVVLV